MSLPTCFAHLPLSCLIISLFAFLCGLNFRYVKLQYQSVSSLDEACRVFEKETRKKDGNQFVEGIMFSLNRGVIMTGNMVNSAEPGKVRTASPSNYLNE